jgi:uncharacterized protein YigA (DUF484 family)
MEGFSTTELSTGSHVAHMRAGEDDGCGLEISSCAGSLGPSLTGSAGEHASGSEPFGVTPEDHTSGLFDQRDDNRLIRSFDMIFQLHQRSEEIRLHLEYIDRLLLNSRTVAGLAEHLIIALENNLDLVAARLLFRQDHPVTQIFKWAMPRSTGIIPSSFVEHESLFPSGPFVLDNPNGDLALSLFGEATPLLSSAIAANLSVDGEDLGLLCLGSDDPSRYCGGMNTDLIASLADKIALGIRNAWDHEKHSRESLLGSAQGVYSESFFREYLAKEFDRSWRKHNTFSLMALSWTSLSEDTRVDEIARLISANIRSSDVAAEADSTCLWILLPETGLNGARLAAERLTSRIAEHFYQEVSLHCGITAFSKDATVMSVLMNRARAALEEAAQDESNSIVVKI